MLRFLLTKLGLLVPTFLGVTFIAFIFIRLLPGDPIELMAGERGVDPDRHARLMAELGYDKPVWEQYAIYIGPMVAGIFQQSRGKPFLLNHQHVGLSLMVQPGRYAPEIFMHIDGQRSFQEIFDRVRRDPAHRQAPPGNPRLFDDFRENFDVLNAIERILLRHRSVTLPAPV